MALSMTIRPIHLLPLALIITVGCGGEAPTNGPDDDERQSQWNRLPKLPDKLAPPTKPTVTTLDVVRHHSPVIYQDTYKRTWKGKEYVNSYITKINWAGSYTPEDSLDAVATHPMTPHVYYSFSATQTHFFIGYFVYHLFRDPNPQYLRVSHHFDGVTLAVAKKGASYGGGVCQEQHGCLVAMITRAGGDFFQYNDLGYGYQLESGSSNIDAPISTTGAAFNGDGATGRHPRIFISHSSHDVYSCAHSSKASCGSSHNDGIIYYLRQSGTPSAAPDPTTGGAGSYTKRYTYGLIALDAASGDRGPWALRNWRDDSETSSCAPTGACTFDSWGKLNASGDLMPWAWDDSDDGPTYAGDLLCDPVKLFDIQLDGAPFENNRFSHRYISHPYWTHRVKLSRIRPTTSKYDFLVHFDVTASNPPSGTDKIFGSGHWRNRTYPMQDNYPSYGGGSHPVEDDITYGDSSNEHYFCRPNRQDGADTAIRIRGKTLGAQIWYYGAWMGTPGTKIVKTNHYTCQSYGCAWVDFEMESNPNNNFLHLL